MRKLNKELGEAVTDAFAGHGYDVLSISSHNYGSYVYFSVRTKKL